VILCKDVTRQQGVIISHQLINAAHKVSECTIVPYCERGTDRSLSNCLLPLAITFRKQLYITLVTVIHLDVSWKYIFCISALAAMCW